MSKYSRHQSVISRQSEAYIDEDNWMHKLEQSLQKEAVQPRNVDQSIFEQITSIMNGKSKHPSVQAAVDDMKNRSGLTAYLSNMNKVSNEKPVKKTAADDNKAIDKQVSMVPIVFKKCPKISQTAKNYVESTRGNLPVPAIIDKLKSIHHSDVSDAQDWEDDKLIRAVSQLNLREKSKNSSTDFGHEQLGTKDDNNNDSEIDPSNMDAFHSLNPVKF